MSGRKRLAYWTGKTGAAWVETCGQVKRNGESHLRHDHHRFENGTRLEWLLRFCGGYSRVADNWAVAGQFALYEPATPSPPLFVLVRCLTRWEPRSAPHGDPVPPHRQRPAPKAVRIANTFRRAVPRATNRLATFRHPIKRRHPVVLRRAYSGVLTSPTASNTIPIRPSLPSIGWWSAISSGSANGGEHCCGYESRNAKRNLPARAGPISCIAFSMRKRSLASSLARRIPRFSLEVIA